MATREIIRTPFKDRRLPWHRMSQPFSTKITATEALSARGADYTVVKLPTLAVLPNGEHMEVKDSFTIARPPTAFDDKWATLGQVGKGYTLLQNSDIAEALDESGITKEWDVDNVGFVNAGQKMYISLRAKSIELAHEQIDEYMLLITGHDGMTRTKAMFSPMRMACTNALLLGVREATTTVTFSHTRKIQERTRVSISDLYTAKTNQQKLKDVLHSFSTLKLSTDQVQSLIQTTYPLPVLPPNLRPYIDSETLVPYKDLSQDHKDVLHAHELTLERQAQLQRLALRTYEEYNDTGHPLNRGTAWNLYNTGTDISGFRTNKNSREDRPERVENILFGSRAREMGTLFTAIQDLLKVS